MSSAIPVALFAIVMGLVVIAQLVIVLVNKGEDGRPMRPSLATSVGGLVANAAAVFSGVMICVHDRLLESPGPVLTVAGILGGCAWATDLSERAFSAYARRLAR